MKVLRAIYLAVLATTIFTGCKPDAVCAQRLKSSTRVSIQPQCTHLWSKTPAPSVGVVSFQGQALRHASPLTCPWTPPALSDRRHRTLSEQYIVNDGKLANVFVYVKSFQPVAGITGYGSVMVGPVVLDQKNCRYTPHVIAIQTGRDRWSSATPIPPCTTSTIPSRIAGNPTRSTSPQGPAGTPQTPSQFTTPETQAMPIRCNNHPWMEALLNVAPNPWFAVTRERRHLPAIPGLPPGTYYRWPPHEKLGERDSICRSPLLQNPRSLGQIFTFAMK